MIDCAAMSDRMPEVAHGIARWDAVDEAHLASCDGCMREWRLVQSGTALGADVRLDLSRIVRSLLARSRRDRIMRTAWRAAAGGGVALAASIALILSLPHQHVPAGAPSDTLASAVVIPELQRLDQTQLEAVLRSVKTPASDASPTVTAHLEDLTDAELQQLLQSEEGQ